MHSGTHGASASSGLPAGDHGIAKRQLHFYLPPLLQEEQEEVSSGSIWICTSNLAAVCLEWTHKSVAKQGAEHICHAVAPPLTHLVVVPIPASSLSLPAPISPSLLTFHPHTNLLPLAAPEDLLLHTQTAPFAICSFYATEM